MKISTVLISFSAAAVCLWLMMFESEVRAQPAPVHGAAASAAMAVAR
jgi:hypothetical protein